ncbi:MAG: N-acetylmuramoyl-L-alanine amidase [Chitinivibrionales bacterium]
MGIIKRYPAFLVCLIFLLSGELFSAESPVKLRIENEKVDIPCVPDDVPCVSVTGMCEALGFSWEWSRIDRRIKIYGAENRLVLSQGLKYCSINGSTMQLHTPPFRDVGLLYLNLFDAITVFSELTGKRLVWEQGVISIDTGKVHVSVLTPETKEGSSMKKPSPGRASYDDLDSSQLIQTIVIDPGHGGKDPGAIGQNGTMEKDVVLSIARKLRDALEKKSSVDVILTRDDDTFIPLRERTDIANKMEADLFVSIHANAIGGSKREKVKGYKVYFLSPAKSAEDKRTAMLENSAVEFEEEPELSVEGNSLSNILADMTTNEYLKESQDFSIFIEDTFSDRLKRVRRLHNGIGQANFWVLNGALMPSVLIETGFISNSGEEKVLIDEGFQKRQAEAIANSITEFKERCESGL